jgi:hypothetical protein
MKRSAAAFLVLCLAASCTSKSGDDASAQLPTDGCVEPSRCDPNAVCARENDVDTCRCASGFDDVAADGTRCVDLDECALDATRCGNGGVCVNVNGGLRCNCPSGFADRAGHCEDVDECQAGTHDCSLPSECLNSIGAFRCQCPEGYRNVTGVCDGCERGYVATSPGICTAGTVDCALNPQVCQPGGTCVDEALRDSCACSQGHTGQTCARCDEGYQDNDGDGRCSPLCATAGLACGAHQTCVDASGSATCVCARGYVGTACENCDTGFIDRSGDGNCVAVTCAAALVTCSGHASCVDRTYPPACRCDIGWSGASCDACAPTHVADGGLCAPSAAIDARRFIYAAGTDEFDRPVLGAIELSSWSFLPMVQLTQPVADLTSDPMGNLYALGGGYDRSIVRVDPVTGAVTLVRNLAPSYHALEALTFDSTRRQLYVAASIGAGDYLLTFDPRSGALSVGGSSINSSSKEVGLAYRHASDSVHGVAAYVMSGGSAYPQQAFTFEPSGANFKLGAFVDVTPTFSSPALVMNERSTFVGGLRASTENEWLHAYCRRVVETLGVPAEGMTIEGDFTHDGIPGSGTKTLVSNPGGARLHVHGSYDTATTARSTLRIETTNPKDVVCVATYEENVDVVLTAAAKLRLLVVASSIPNPRLAVDPGFAFPPDSGAAPIRAYCASSAPHDSFSGSSVRIYGSSEWSTLGLKPPSHDVFFPRTSFVGPLDFDAGVTQPHVLSNVNLTGGLAAVPCCAQLSPVPYCDSSGRVARVIGWCDAAQRCQSTTMIDDDCTNRTAHPITSVCLPQGPAVRTPACGLTDAGVGACQFIDSLLDACDVPGKCDVSADGGVTFTSAESCRFDAGSPMCATTTTSCVPPSAICSAGSRTTYSASCSASAGCGTTPSVGSCPTAAAYCASGAPNEHVRYLPTCGDGGACAPGTEVRTSCAAQMCVGASWVSYGTPTCDPDAGCGGDVLSTTSCPAQNGTAYCSDYKHLSQKRCTCTPGVGCECAIVTEACPDRDDECVGTGGRTLRTYNPFCDSATNKCSWTAPDAICPNSCQKRTGPDVCL